MYQQELWVNEMQIDLLREIEGVLQNKKSSEAEQKAERHAKKRTEAETQSDRAERIQSFKIANTSFGSEFTLMID